MPHPHTFIESLSLAIRQDPLGEKVLLVPSHRVGRQWLDQIARRLGGCINLRTTTIDRLLLDHAEGELRRRGLRHPTTPEQLRLAGMALAATATENGGDGYFTKLSPSLALVEALSRARNELLANAVRSGKVLHRAVSPSAKAAELVRFMGHADALQAKSGLATPGDILAAALLGLENAGETLPLLLVPEAMLAELDAAHRTVVEAWPATRRMVLEERVGKPQAEFSLFTADTVANEAREIIRRITGAAIPLDQVEIICIDPDTYVPALCVAALEFFGGTVEDLPLTITGGLPGRYARPVRLLSAWLDWLDENLPAEGLARMIDCGLLGYGWSRAGKGVPASVLAGRLRQLPINGGPGDYARLLAKCGPSGLTAAESWLAERIRNMVPLARDGITLDCGNPGAVLAAAEALLAPPDAGDDKLDAYARASLVETIRAWRPHCGWPGFDAMAWLRDLASGVRLMGLGPLPGKAHLSDLRSGGSCCRPHTFIAGLDDSRFPGQSRQDAVLLDRERAGISSRLRPSGTWRELREGWLDRLIATLEGRVVLSHSRYESSGGRELFPAAVLDRLAEAVSLSAAARPAALVPEQVDTGLCDRDDWLMALLDRQADCEQLAPWFPRLARKAVADAARDSDRFTEYDGHVPDAGIEWDPRSGRVFSPTELESLATCPLEFLFSRVLGIAWPDRYQPGSGRWLEGHQRGSLLHDLFHTFLDRLEERKEPVSPERFSDQHALLHSLLQEQIDAHLKTMPPRDHLACRRDISELAEAADIFLLTEMERQKHGRPLYGEVTLGGARTIRTPWDRADPVPVRLPSGTEWLIRGRVDRIDRLEAGGLVIIDYKTGSSGKFPREDPFRQGRLLQPFLYTRMLETAIAAMGLPEPVRCFAYFFPMPRDEGIAVEYSRERLGATGEDILARLESLLAEGRFPFTPDADDVKYSDYLPLYGDPWRLAEQIRTKALTDPMLAGWRELREVQP